MNVSRYDGLSVVDRMRGLRGICGLRGVLCALACGAARRLVCAGGATRVWGAARAVDRVL